MTSTSEAVKMLGAHQTILLSFDYRSNGWYHFSMQVWAAIEKENADLYSFDVQDLCKPALAYEAYSRPMQYLTLDHMSACRS